MTKCVYLIEPGISKHNRQSEEIDKHELTNY